MCRGFVQSYTIHCYITRPMYSGSGKWSRSEGYTPYASHLQYMAHSLLGGTRHYWKFLYVCGILDVSVCVI